MLNEYKLPSLKDKIIEQAEAEKAKETTPAIMTEQESAGGRADKKPDKKKKKQKHE